MLTLNDGRKELYQWDTGRTATVDIECDIVHFANLKYGESLAVEVKEGEVSIPNKLLMSGEPIYCWAFAKDDGGSYTKKEQTIVVTKRAKPSDYVYTETEVISIQTAVENALQEAKESGDFKGEKGDTGATGPMGPAGKDGANGKDGVDGKDGTSVTVSSVSESTEDGGNNVVTFSDGETLTVKNGSKGSQGEKGDPTDVQQTTGQSATAVMSQKATTDELAEKVTKLSAGTSELAYTVQTNGVQSSRGITESATGDTIVKRTYGGEIKASDPTSEDSVATMRFVEKQVQESRNIAHYGARWNKTQAQMTRLYDAASFPTDTKNFGHFGSVNANYSNPFDKIYPWSGIKLCNIDIEAYRALEAGDRITKCDKAWEGDIDFSYEDESGVWRYRPEFWGRSYEEGEYRYFDVSDKSLGGYVYYPEAIAGRWHGRAVTMSVGGEEKTCLIPSAGMPSAGVVLSSLHEYAGNYGATLDSIYSTDADVLLYIVEYADMNSQNALGQGVASVFRQSGDKIIEAVNGGSVIKVQATAAEACEPGAIVDIGTSDGRNDLGSYYVVSVSEDAEDAQYADVTLNAAVTAEAGSYWSVHGIINKPDEEIGSGSGYIGENGKSNVYYRGIVMYGNMWLYTLGAYRRNADHHIWTAADEAEADAYDALNTGVHTDTGITAASGRGYINKLGMLTRSGLLSASAFCTEIGGDSSNPVGDYHDGNTVSSDGILLFGGCTDTSLYNGMFCARWTYTALNREWRIGARPRLKRPAAALN